MQWVAFFALLVVIAIFKKPRQPQQRVLKLLYRGRPKIVGDWLHFDCGCRCRIDDMEPENLVRYDRMTLCQAHENVKEASGR